MNNFQPSLVKAKDLCAVRCQLLAVSSRQRTESPKEDGWLDRHRVRLVASSSESQIKCQKFRFDLSPRASSRLLAFVRSALRRVGDRTRTRRDRLKGTKAAEREKECCPAVVD